MFSEYHRGNFLLSIAMPLLFRTTEKSPLSVKLEAFPFYLSQRNRTRLEDFIGSIMLVIIDSYLNFLSSYF
jgi:hypothetical protein